MFELIVENLEHPERSFNDIVQTNIKDAEKTGKALCEDECAEIKRLRKENDVAG